MFRTTDIVLIAAMVAAAGFTYVTKHAAEAELSQLRRLESNIRLEEEAIDVLKADWSLLTQPSRLQRLAEIYHEDLQLAPVEPHQFAGIGELPERALQIEDFLNEIAGSGIDTTTTSGVSE